MKRACRIVATAALALALPSASAAEPSPGTRIATFLALADPLPVDARDLTTPSALRDALEATGLVRVAGGRYAFTPRGLAASRACPRADDLDDPATRCFAIARRTFVRIVATRTAEATADASARRLSFFSFRAAPATPLGRTLASRGALVCDGPTGGAIAWHGRRTVAYGEYSRIAGRRDDDVIADCPRGPRYLSPVDSR